MAAVRRKSVSIPLEELNKGPTANLSRQEQQDLGLFYKKVPKLSGGGISFYDMLQILTEFGWKVSETRRKEFTKEIAEKQIRILELPQLYWAASCLKKEKEDHEQNKVTEDSEFLDSFVALGGHPDKSGFVSKSTLIHVITKEFELAFDPEELLEGHSDQLTFEQFCELLHKEAGNITGMDRSNSLRSLSEALIGQNLYTERSISLHVNPEAFELYEEKLNSGLHSGVHS